MVTIRNLSLEMVENDGIAAALVSYQLVASQADVLEQRVYNEVIELFGVDEGPGEDGQNELIAGGRAEKSVTFSRPTGVEEDHIQLFALPSIDEDRGTNPSAGLLEDEIRARVTLTHIIQPVRLNSNVVLRGRP